jgi:hypothetical protein
VVVQIPNIPLAGWLVFAALARIPGPGAWTSGASRTGSAFLFVWAYLELAQGVNYFRRLLGLVVLTVVAAGWF